MVARSQDVTLKLLPSLHRNENFSLNSFSYFISHSFLTERSEVKMFKEKGKIMYLELPENVLRHVVLCQWVHNEVLVSAGEKMIE